MKHLVLAFHGHIEHDEQLTYAIGDDAPVFVHGLTEDEAIQRFSQGVLVYVTSLAETGELGSIVQSGRGRLKLGAQPRGQVTTIVERDADGFDIEVSGTR